MKRYQSSPWPFSRSITSYQPPRCRSLPTVGMISAIFFASSTYLLLGRMLLMRIRFHAIFRLWPTTARLCCHLYEWSGVQSSWKRSFTNGLFS